MTIVQLVYKYLIINPSWCVCVCVTACVFLYLGGKQDIKSLQGLEYLTVWPCGEI